jgi:hypothetical protein
VTIDDIDARIAELEEEIERLRPIEAAAHEAYAFLSGRRPGFAPSYAFDVLRAALEPQKPRRGRTRPKKPRLK